MTLPASGPISMANVNTELQRSSTTTVSLNDTIVRTLFGVPSGQISMSNGYGKAYTVPGNSGILTSGSSFTLPTTSGLTINVLVIGAGGGGGGGNGRTYASGSYLGGGGGGAGGDSYALSISVTPGQIVEYEIGSAGAAGGTRDGPFSSGSNGGTGGTTRVVINGISRATATGGSGGGVAAATGSTGGGGAGSAGGTTIGTQYLSPTAGTAAVAWSPPSGNGDAQGGPGAKGYTINTTVGLSLSSILGYGVSGVTYTSGTYGIPGTIYGAGGSGGGTNQSDVFYSLNPRIYASAATTGAVFIWWGY